VLTRRTGTFGTFAPPRRRQVRRGTDRHPSRLVHRIGVGLAVLVLAACSRAEGVPSGAQQVHVVVANTEVLLEPATVRAGEIYLVLVAPADASITFVERKDAADATPGPLTDDDVARLERGDLEHTSSTGLDAGGCSEEQNAADRGRMGPCGNVMRVVVAPGTYAIVGGAPETDPATGGRPPMALLHVLP
jgi:hypothetical protein